jgi:hypothetical protein
MESGGDENTKNLSISTKPNKDNGTSDTKQSTSSIILDEVDRLKLENAQLKLMNAEARIREAQRGIEALNRSYVEMLTELSNRYGFNPATTELEPGTGRVVPRGTIPR